MITLGAIQQYVDGEDFVAAIQNRPIVDLDGNITTLANFLNSILDYSTGDGSLSLKHNGTEVVKTLDGGFSITNGSFTTTIEMDGEVLKIKNTAGDGSIELWADADGPSGAEPVLKILGSASGGLPSRVELWADGNRIAYTYDDQLNMDGNRVTNVDEPILGSDAATKTYVDDSISGGVTSDKTFDKLPLSNGYHDRLFGAITTSGKFLNCGYSGATTASSGWGCNDTGSRWLPSEVTLPDNERYELVSMSYDSTIVISKTGKVYTWGRNSNGELGMGDTTHRSHPILVNHSWSGVPVYACMRSARGWNQNTFVVTDTGVMYATGRNDHGALGLGHSIQQTSFQTVPVPSLGGVWVSAISDGKSAYALSSLGHLYAAGRNNDGVLGRNTTTASDVFQPILDGSLNPIDNVVKYDMTGADTGGQTGYILDNGGYMYTVGYNGYASGGISGSADQKTASLIQTGVTDFVVTGEEYKTGILLKSDGTLKGFGRNDHGQLGQGHTSQVNSPTTLHNDGVTITNAVAIYGKACQIDGNLFYKDSAGVLWGSGSNRRGSTGVGVHPSGGTNSFSKVLISDEVVDVGAAHMVNNGNIHETNYFLTINGDLYASGYSVDGECGVGDTTIEGFYVPTKWRV